MLGVSGAWIGNLRGIESYRPIFILFTVGFFAVSFYSVYRKPVEDCEPGGLCALTQAKKRGKVILWIAVVFAVILLSVPYVIGFLL
jgi:mercuric ion transport protein